MKLRVRRGGIMNPPSEIEDIDSVVVFTPNGHPVAAAVSIEGKVMVSTAKDPDFVDIMMHLGVKPAEMTNFRDVTALTM